MAICTTDNRVEDDWMDIGKSVYNPTGTKYYTEPIQGCVKNCFFMAALVSVAWAANTKLKIHPVYQFHNGNSWDPSFEINKDLAVDTTDNLVYGRTSSQYIWPCLYEKAYAKWKDAPDHRDEPPIGIILNGGNGIHALQNICGGTRYSNTTTPGLTIPVNPRSGNKTIYPSVAYTKKSPESSQLTSNHTYSVLRITGDGWELRNPCTGSLIYIPTIDANNFDEWGYVK